MCYIVWNGEREAVNSERKTEDMEDLRAEKLQMRTRIE